MRSSVPRMLARVLVAVVVLALVAAALVWWRGRTAGSSGASPLTQPVAVAKDGTPLPAGKPVATASGGPGQVRSATVNFFLDGWSLAALAGRHSTWQLPGGAHGKVRWVPVTAGDVQTLLATTPNLVRDVLAREVSGAQDVACNAGGCTIHGHAVDAARMITDPGSVPGFGPSYEAWGVRSLLYRTAVTAPHAARSVTLDVSGMQPYTVLAVPTGKQPTRDNGYLYNRYLLGAAFGQLFLVTPQWTQPGPHVYRYRAVGPVPGIPVTPNQAEVSVFHTGGLADPWPRSGALSPSVLTYLSSPTAGCDVGVVCTPTSVPVTVTDETEQQAAVCLPDNPNVRALAVFDSAVVTVKLPHPTSQFSMWGGQEPSSFPGADGNGLLEGGTPPLATGTQTLRWGTVGLYTGTDPQLRVTSGVFAPADSPAGTLAATLAKVSPDGLPWKVC